MFDVALHVLYVVLISTYRPCLHKHIFDYNVFDLKRSCLDTFLPFVYTETYTYVHKNAF